MTLKRAEVLQAETNRDLLRLIAGHEDQDAARFATPLTVKAAKKRKAIGKTGGFAQPPKAPDPRGTRSKAAPRLRASTVNPLSARVAFNPPL